MKSHVTDINPLLKMALELGPVVIFFIAYLQIKDETFVIAGTSYDGFIVATAGLIPLLMLSSGVMWLLSGRLSRIQMATLILVIVLGGLTVWLNDARFIKIKPTLVNAVLGGMLGLGLLRGQSWLQYVMGEMMPMSDLGWMIFTRRMMWCFFVLAAANEIVWRNFSEETWVYFDTFVMPGAMFVFFMAHAGLFQRHTNEETSE